MPLVTTMTDKALAEARAAQDARRAANRERHADLNRRARRLFADARAAKGDEFVRAQCSLAGIRNEPEIRAAQARLRVADAALLAESPDMTPEAYADLLKADGRPLPPDVATLNEELIRQNAFPVYRPVAAVRDLVTATNARLKSERPVLNARLKGSGASSAAPVVRRLLRETADSVDAGARAATAGKRWSPPAAVPLAPGRPILG